MLLHNWRRTTCADLPQRALGVDISNAVKLVILTHWHDDHVAGAAKLVESCAAAQVVCSAAFAVDEFREILGLYGIEDRITDKKTSGVRELSVIQEIVERRIAQTGSSLRAISTTRSDHKIYRRGDCELVALAPSSGSIRVAHQELGEILQGLLKSKHAVRTTAPSRNDYSVVLWFGWGPIRVLLGGDLEVTSDPGRGWKALLGCAQFPDGVAQVIKIAHHGSPNGDCDAAWQKIISNQDPIAVLTSYNKGVVPRPSPQDIARLKTRTAAVYHTALPSRSNIRRDRAVEKEINATVRRRRVLTRPVGQIRLRWKLNDVKPSVELYGTGTAA